jgi:hypothetical protein
MSVQQMIGRLSAIGVLLWVLGGAVAVAQQESVMGTVHNLSVSGPGEIRSLEETEVCKFCHVPHNAVVPDPLWGHALSDASYRVPEVRAEGGGRRLAPQPDGSSRLCLSCHDGTVALGDVVGRGSPIRMTVMQELRPGRRGFLGTDLSGSHPISVIVPETDEAPVDSDRDMLLAPRSVVLGDTQLKLDSQFKMQCTTCHDPHSDRYYKEGKVPRFWVKPTLEGVCMACHVVR